MPSARRSAPPPSAAQEAAVDGADEVPNAFEARGAALAAIREYAR